MGPRLEDPGARRYGPRFPGGFVNRTDFGTPDATFVNAWFGTIRTVYAPLQESVRLEVHVLMTAG